MSLSEVILVTGGSGYIGSTTLFQLLKANYTAVRTTVRDSKKQDNFISALKQAGIKQEQLKHLRFFITDLLSDVGWKEAFDGVKYVLHIASPIAHYEPDKIKVAKEGTLRILKFARDSGVRRVIATSSFLTIGFSKEIPKGRLYNETDFTPLEDSFGDYPQSKVIAETAARAFMQKEGGSLEWVTVHPGLVIGPILGTDNARQVWFLTEMMNGKLTPFTDGGGPMSFVDVRDVADLHIRAMEAPNLANRRLLAVADEAIDWIRVSQVLRTKVAAPFNKNVAVVTKSVPETRHGDNSLSRTLGWTPRPIDESIVDTANSLIALGILTGT